jgi:hypothetical protein
MQPYLSQDELLWSFRSHFKLRLMSRIVDNSNHSITSHIDRFLVNRKIVMFDNGMASMINEILVKF